MTRTPYSTLLFSVVTALRASDYFAGPPCVLVTPESDEPDVTTPGDGHFLSDRVDSALSKAGVAVVVYLQSVTVTEEIFDQVEIRVQVIENVIVNRSQSGTKKPSLNLAHCARSVLSGWQESVNSVWTPLIFEGLDTPNKGATMIREVSFSTTTFMSVK